MSKFNFSISWGMLFGFLGPIFFLAIALIWGMMQPNPSCGFMKVKVADAKDMRALYEDDGLMEEAKFKCEERGVECYQDIIFGSAGGDIYRTMATAPADCVVYYDPNPGGRDIPLVDDSSIESALNDYLARWGGMGIDDAVEANFYATLAHEMKHQEQCFSRGPGHNDTLEEYQQDEIEAYGVYIDAMQSSIRTICAEFLTYCQCDKINYDSASECKTECQSGLGCIGFQCTLPP